jgi:hypothetical protein
LAPPKSKAARLTFSRGEEKESVSSTSVKILQAASEIVGGIEALAERLGIREKVLAVFIEDRRHLPDSLLLRVVDIILEERQSRLAPPGQAAVQPRRPPVG